MLAFHTVAVLVVLSSHLACQLDWRRRDGAQQFEGDCSDQVGGRHRAGERAIHRVIESLLKGRYLRTARHGLQF